MSLLLYDLHVNLKRHVIALLYRYELAIVVVAIRGGDNHVPRLGDSLHAGGMMKITPVRWRWRSKAQEKAIPCHIIELHVMFIPLCILFCVITTVAL